MLVHVTQVLNKEQLAHIHKSIAKAEFTDGKSTAPLAAERGFKKNLQLTVQTDTGEKVSNFIKAILEKDLRIWEITYAKVMMPLMVSRYEEGMHYAAHVDSPMLGFTNPIRSDISMTLFLNSPTEYDGGELIIESDYGTHVCKAEAGDLILYPSTMLHEVKPITRGCRIVMVGWMQSLIRDVQQRRILFDLSALANRMEKEEQQGVQIVKKTYYNLLRMWIEA